MNMLFWKPGLNSLSHIIMVMKKRYLIHQTNETCYRKRIGRYAGRKEAKKVTEIDKKFYFYNFDHSSVLEQCGKRDHILSGK